MTGSVVWSPDGTRLASGSHDSNVRVWTEEMNVNWSSRILAGHSDMLNSVVWSPDSTGLASGSNDGDVRVWTEESNANWSSRVLEGHTSPALLVVWITAVSYTHLRAHETGAYP
eukprot:7045160-Pyramimonas_sp.AAC.1